MKIRFESDVISGFRGKKMLQYAMLTENDDSARNAVCRAIARKTRTVLAGCQHTGFNRDGNHYQMSFGQRRQGGGILISGRINIIIPNV